MMVTERDDKRAKLDALLRQNPLLWRGESQIKNAQLESIYLDTGFTDLNQALPGGGWPLGCVIEIVVSEWGQGELSILLPLLASVSQQAKPLVFIAPPYVPYAPAFELAGVDLQWLWMIDQEVKHKDIAWAAEKSLSGARGGVVLIWMSRYGHKQIRHLQVAADRGATLGVLMHCGEGWPTPVPLRLGVQYRQQGLAVEILKSRQIVKQSRPLALTL